VPESSVDKLIEIAKELRRRCPWDSVQTLESLSPFILEEAYELVDAMKSGEGGKIKEELGDLMYLVLLCCVICGESRGFGVEEVAGEISGKMVCRHPAVFAEGGSEADTSDYPTWYRLKRENDKARKKRFAGIPAPLPALLKAEKVQLEAAALGFDWKDAAGVVKKVEEELSELKRALSGEGDVEHELGDLLFSVVNLSRFLHVSAEMALMSCARRFCRRFSLMEDELGRKGIPIEDASMEEMDSAWENLK